jgi:CHAT domain-containing protein/Flp pilus assembly protein TadD
MTGGAGLPVRHAGAGAFVLGAAWALSVAGCSPSHEPSPAAECVEQPLAGPPAPRSFATAAAHCYTLPRQGDEVLHGAVEQRGSDVVLALVDPRGREVLRLDGLAGSRGTEVFDAVAGASGAYRLRLEPPGPGGSYVLSVDPAHPASRVERIRAEAARELAAGDLLRRQETGSGLRDSLPYFARARRLWMDARDPAAADLALFRSGLVQSALGRWDEALETFRELRPRWRGHLLELRLLNETGNVLVRTGRLAEAIGEYRAALQVAADEGDREGEASARTNVGALLARSGDLAGAEAELRQALHLLADQPDAADRGATVNHLGFLLLSLGKADEALDVCRIAPPESVKDEIDRLRLEGTAHQQLSQTRFGQAAEHRRQAVDLLEQAVRRAREVDDPRKLRAGLLDLGTALFEQERYAAARPPFTEALRLSVASIAWNDLALADAHLGMIEVLERRDADGLVRLQRAREVFEQRGSRVAAAQIVYGQAWALQELGRPTEARAAIIEAIARTEALLREAQTIEQGLFFVASRRLQYELPVEILFDLDRARPGDGFARQAFAPGERRKARVLLDELAEKRDLPGLDPALAGRWRELQRRLRALHAEIEALLGRTDAWGQADRRRHGSLEARIATVLGQLREVERQIARACPRCRELLQPRLLSLEEAQALLDPETTLVSFAVHRGATYVWILGEKEVAWRELTVGEEELHRQVEAAAAAWRPGAWEQGLPDLRKLSSTLLGPLAGRLSTRRLVFVADGPLHGVPFAALLVPGGEGRRYLVEKHEIVLLPSASVLQELRRLRGRPPAPRLLTAFADPQIPTSPRFRPLPAAGAEAAQVVAIARRHGPAQALTGAAAHLGRLTGPEVSQAQILHFAVHAEADAEHPAQSRIVLADPRGGIGFLRAVDIYQLRLAAELVVLGACETGTGRSVPGEGVISLARGFFFAGSPRVLVSLWRINDRATARLMIHFYQGLLDRGLAPAAALRAAQLALLQGPERSWRAPYYWAGLTLQGDWEWSAPHNPPPNVSFLTEAVGDQFPHSDRKE